MSVDLFGLGILRADPVVFVLYASSERVALAPSEPLINKPTTPARRRTDVVARLSSESGLVLVRQTD